MQGIKLAEFIFTLPFLLILIPKTSARCTTVSNCEICNDGKSCNSCKDGYYITLSNDATRFICLKCSSSCLTCKNYDQCYTCYNGFFANSEMECEPCIISCDKCNNTNTCNECHSTFYLNNNLTCSKCHEDCYECTGPSSHECTSCKPNYYPSDPTGSTFSCVKCDPNCDTCINSTHCNQCLSHYYLLNDGKCGKCNEKCMECNGPSQLDCITCSYGYYYDSQIKRCLNCDVGCKICNGPSDCTTCFDGYYRDSNLCRECPNGCKTCSDDQTCNSCNDGYFLYSNKCYICDLSCLTCENEADKCIECSDGYKFDDLNKHCVKLISESIPFSVPIESMTFIGEFHCHQSYCDDDLNNPSCGKSCYSINHFTSYEYTFKGVVFQLFGTFDTVHGKYQVELDDQILTTIDQRRPRKEKALQYTSDILPYQQHTVRIKGVGDIFEFYKITYWPSIKAKRLNLSEFDEYNGWNYQSDKIGGLHFTSKSSGSYVSTQLKASKIWIYGSFGSNYGAFNVQYRDINDIIDESISGDDKINALVYETDELMSDLGTLSISPTSSTQVGLNCIYYIDENEEEEKTESPTDTFSSDYFSSPESSSSLETSSSLESSPESSSLESSLPSFTPSQTPTPLRTIIPQIPVFSIQSDSETFEINSQGFIDNKNKQISVDNSSETLNAISFGNKIIEIRESSKFYSTSPLYFIASSSDAKIKIDKEFKMTNIGVYSTNNPTVVIKNNDNYFLNFMNQLNSGGQITISTEFDQNEVNNNKQLKFNEIYNQMGNLKINIPNDFDEILLSKLIMTYYSSLNIISYSKTKSTNTLSNEKKLFVLDNFTISKESEISIDNLHLNGTLNIFSDSKLRINNEISFLDNSVVDIVVEEWKEGSEPLLTAKNLIGFPQKIILNARPNFKEESNSKVLLAEAVNDIITCKHVLDRTYAKVDDKEVKIQNENCDDSTGIIIISYEFHGLSGGNGGKNGNGFPIGAIIGIVVGCVVLIAIVVLLVIFFLRRNKRNISTNEIVNPEKDVITPEEDNVAI